MLGLVIGLISFETKRYCSPNSVPPKHTIMTASITVPSPILTTLTSNAGWAMVIHSRAKKNQGNGSVSLKATVKTNRRTNGRTDMTDCITFPANVVNNWKASLEVASNTCNTFSQPQNCTAALLVTPPRYDCETLQCNACIFVCLSAHISQKPYVRTLLNFLYMLNVTVAWSAVTSSAIHVM